MTIFQKPALAELANESDVEQKFVYPLFTAEMPDGFAVPTVNIQTKRDIRRFTIGKGSNQKLYYPDYMIDIAGIPLLIIEVKGPDVDLGEAYREARLYAAELNAVYPSGLNPLRFIVATNGNETQIGYADQSAPILSLPYSDIKPYSQAMAEAQSLVGFDALNIEFRRVSAIIRPNKYHKPRRLLGGTSVQNEEVGHNSFGATISADFAHVFNPVSRQDRANIVRHGYISSKRRERYIDPIDRVIRASAPFSEVDATLIENTDKPVEIIKPFLAQKQLEHQVLLIVGSVGSGKTTFIDYLQEVALPKDIKERTVWVHLNMNPAPISRTEIYDWLRKEIVIGLQSCYQEIDFDELDCIKAVYAVEVNKFNKGIGKLFTKDGEEYNRKLAEVIEASISNLHIQALNHVRYCGADRNKLVVIVLDNLDKRLRDEQLLMFEAAQWLQKEFRALVVLPLREETYDNHRNEPPLDTALKDLVFRIEPALFHPVLVSRVQMALNEIEKSAPRKHSYDLPNGFKVEYPASEQAYYLTSIVRSIFEHDRQVRRMIVGLAGRNLRRALEIFLEFCTSGHISEEHIVRIRQSEGDYVLPLHLVTTVLLRGSRRFYDSDEAFLKNIVDMDVKDQRPGYFSRMMILRWLYSKISIAGPSGLKGYFPISDIYSDLSIYGLEPSVVRREVEHLAKAHCIVTEDFKEEDIDDGDLVRLAPAGFVHLDMMGSASYWGTVAEDTWFDDESIARRISSRINDFGNHYGASTVLHNGRDLLEYLKVIQDIGSIASRTVLQNSRYDELTDLSEGFDAIARMQRALTSGPWVDLQKRFQIDATYDAIVANAVAFGVFAELEPGITGLVHSSKLPRGFQDDEKFMIGEAIRVKIKSIDPIKRRVGLEYVKPSAGSSPAQAPAP